MTTQQTQPATKDASGTQPAQRHTSASPTASARGAWLLVATREVVVRLTNRTFLISTFVTLLFIAGFAGWSVAQGNSTTTHRVAVSGQPAADIVRAAVPRIAELDEEDAIQPVVVADDASARAALEDESADAWLHRTANGYVLTTQGDLDGTLRTALADAVRDAALRSNAATVGTSVESLTAGTELTTQRLQGTDEEAGFVKFATFVFALLFLMAATLFGTQIATSVIEEKQSRLVEIIATAIPLRHLLAGKVVGNSVIALGQVLLFAAVGLFAASFTDVSALAVGLSAAVVWFVVFFAVGFVAIACLFAVGGALASRTEDIQSTTAPVTMGLMGVYFVGFGASGTTLTVSSYVPVASVVAMPARVLSREAAWWEPLVSLGLLAAFVALTMAVGERVYRRSLLRTTGGRLSWRQALRTEE